MLCGIAGEVAFQGARADTAPVQAMLETLAQARGKDTTVQPTGWTALGQVRRDHASKQGVCQPTIDTEHELAVVFDGHLFNRAELASQTAMDDSGSTDADVVLAAYRHWGERFVEHLHGNFAIVLTDQRRHRVLLCRDRLGVKPLYVAQLDDRLRFASTLPALVASGGIDTSVDKVALHHYMSWHSIVPAPRTMLTGVTKLPPATMQIIDADGQSQERVYWQPDYARNPAYANWSATDWHEAITDALRKSVQRGIVTSERLGVLLSGGLDSSLLVAFLAEAGLHDIPTFSVGFDTVGEHTGNEFEYSDRIAEVFNTDHYTLRISTSDLSLAVDDAIAAMTEPMASHDVPAFFLHSQAVAQQADLVHCGQGADEIFAGYNYHRQAAAVPRGEALAPFTDAFEDHDQAGLAAILNPAWITPTNVSRQLLTDYLDAPGAETAVDAVLRLETQFIMADDPVKRVSNMSSAAGLQAHLPFLDHEFVELVIACPTDLRTAQDGKGILKDIGRRFLPPEVIDRPKGYFPVPALQHLEGPILAKVTEALQAPEARERGLFRTDFIDELLAHPNDHYVPTGGNMLWQVGLLEMWLQQHGVG